MSGPGALYFASFAGAVAILVASGPVEIALAEGATSDLSYIWAGPRALLAGYDPYDPAGWSAASAALGTQQAWPPVHSYPPAVLVALLPLALLPLPLVVALWLAVTPTLAALALRALLADVVPAARWTHAVAPVALLLSAPAVIALRGGQWTFVLVAALAAAVVLVRRGRPVPAGITAGALLAKAHLFLLAVPSLALASGRPRRLVLAIAGVAAIPVLGSALARPDWWVTWWTLVATARPAEPHITTAWRVLPDSLGAVGVLLALALLVGSVTLLVVVRRDRDMAMAAGIAASLALAPFMRSYDHVLALVPIVLTTGIVARAHPTAADAFGAAALAAFTLGTWVLLRAGEARANESIAWIALLAVLGSVVVAIAASRRAGATPARRPGSPRP